jgi:beta-N-acetylhexosaminidase
MNDQLERMALGCLLAAFDGTMVPDWMRRRVADGLGGIVLFSNNIESPDRVAALTAALRDERDDIVIATDEEGGDVTRLEAVSGSSYPGNLALGQVNDPALTQAVAASIGRDLAAAGINLDFAPVADVNTNPDNPIIGVRSFGDRPELVAAHVVAFIKGLQSQGVAACAKHFPGHGDTIVDSHRDLPVSNQDMEQLATGALVPFRAAIQAGVEAIMTAHLMLPAYDSLPATLSRRILSDLLRRQLGFTGLVVTDALEMGAISRTRGPNEAAVMALLAGADAICLGRDHADDNLVDGVTRSIVQAVETGRLDRERLADAVERVRRVAARYRLDNDRQQASRQDPEIGLEAARRAIRVEGAVHIDEAPVVVELDPEPSAAAGAVPWGIGDLLAARDPAITVVRFDAPPVDVEQVPGAKARRPLIIVVRDLHRHAWAVSAVEAIRARHPDAVLVEMGLPRMVPADTATYMATFGAARVNALAAVEILARRAAIPAPTEQPHNRSADLHRLETRALLELMHREDRRAVEQVGQCLDVIAQAVTAITERLRRGGRLHYFGAGTSGRLAALDAIECPGTFGIAGDLVVPHVAATDAGEDDLALGVEESRTAGLGPNDAVVGVSASGETDYVGAALNYAQEQGALTVALTCAPGSSLGRAAAIAIEVPTGPELIAGSTRLKAGTAQKVVLNMLSTAVFTRLGHVYRGRMIDVLPSNEKLRRRAAQIVRDLTGASARDADDALTRAGGNAKLAVLMLQTGLPADAARARLTAGHGDLSVALGEPS